MPLSWDARTTAVKIVPRPARSPRYKMRWLGGEFEVVSTTSTRFATFATHASACVGWTWRRFGGQIQVHIASDAVVCRSG